jgi:hypothetical protein
MANWLTKRSKGRRYDAYLYSSRGYLRLLQQAGFTEPQVFVAKESYNNPEAIVPLTRGPSRHFFGAMDVKPQSVLRKCVQVLAARLGLLGHMQYAFIVIGTKQ